MQRYRGITFPFLEASRNLSALSTEPKKENRFKNQQKTKL
jgi:hypothetical protein